MIVTKDLRVDELGEILFEKVSVVIRAGERVGVMAQLSPNQNIVTTFLRVLAGEIEMDQGKVIIEGERVVHVSLKGDTDGAELKAVESFEKLLATCPTFLFLEVFGIANSKVIQKIKELIESFQGGMLIASDDELLMRAAKLTRFFEMQPSTKSVASFTANYTDFVAEREKRELQLSEAYKKQQKEKKRLEEWLEQKRKEAAIDRSPQKGATIRTKAKYLQREILDKEIPKPAQFDEPD